MPVAKGFFIAVEGIEGVGKSTAITAMRRYFAKINLEAVFTREPGGTPLAEEIRALLLQSDRDENMQPITELLLMFAARAQHIAECIQPNLARGSWVVSDRYVDATYAYQGGGRGMDEAVIAILERWVAGRFVPDVVLLLDAPPALALARTRQRGQAPDRIEREALTFFANVRAAYLQRAQADAARYIIIDATQPLACVEDAIYAVLDALVLRGSCAG